ncbi:MAG: tetratricopeptide repeat protein [Lachnospiraceae bacterium]|nr:tetratricopeptide repeat protein [Lachnospiraceae bacterium]MDD3615548.1 tetratricopeptide repeat protein [Lachnospiraceae bacterium]
MKKQGLGILLSVCLLAGSLSGCGKAEEKDYYGQGVAQLEEQDYSNAITSFEQAVEKEQRVAESYRGLGIAALESRDYPTAISAFSRSLLNLDASNAAFEKDVQCYLASARSQYGENDKAIEVYTEILDKYKEPQFYYLRGKCELDEKDYDAARTDFEQALKGSKDYDMYIMVYETYAEHNMAADGDTYLEEALDIDVVEAQDYYNRGRIYYCLADYDNAKADLIQAMNDGNAEAVLLLGKVYMAVNDMANARAMYKDYMNQNGENPMSYNGLALCDIADGDYETALANVQKGISLGSGNAIKNLLYNEIIIYEYLLDFETAKAKMADYLVLYPSDENALRENTFLSTR